MAALLCVALLAVSPAAQAQTDPDDPCAGTEGEGRLTPDNVYWRDRDRIEAYRTSHPDVWRALCRDLPEPTPPNGGPAVLVSNLGQTSQRAPDSHTWTLNLSDRDHGYFFRTGSNATGYVLDSVDIAFDRLSDSAAFSKMTVVVRGGLNNRLMGTLVPPAFEATNSERIYRFKSQGIPPIHLLPNMQYYVRLDVTSQLSGTNQVAVSTSDDEDADSASGWTIENQRRSAAWNSSNDVIGLTPHGDALKFSVNGSARLADAPPWVQITTTDAAEGGDVMVRATIPMAHSEDLSFWVDMRRCDWTPPRGGLPDPYRGIVGHDAKAACAAGAPGVAYADDDGDDGLDSDDFDKIVKPFINIAAGSTSGSYSIRAKANDGAEPAEVIAFMVAPHGKATHSYLKNMRARDWVHPSTWPDGWSGSIHPLWVAQILQSSNAQIPDAPTVTISTDATSVTEGDDVVFALSADPSPQVDVTVTVAVDMEMGTGNDAVAETEIAQVVIPAGEASATWTVTAMSDDTEREDGTIVGRVLDATADEYTVGTPASVTVALTDDDGTPGGGTQSGVPDRARAGTANQEQTKDSAAVGATLVANVRAMAAQVHHGPVHVNRWRRVLIAFGLETYPGLTPTTAAEAEQNAETYSSPLWPQIAQVLAKLETLDTPAQQDTPQQDTPQQDTPAQQDTPQQGYTVDAAVVTKVRALAAQVHHGPVHVNRWNRVLIAFGEHDGTGVTGGAMTLNEAKQNTERYSSPVWDEVVTELTNLNAAQ